MTDSSPKPAASPREERIGREIVELRERGYVHCELYDDGSSTFVIVKIERDTKEGPQAATVYLILDTMFPQSRPEMKVTIAIRATNHTGSVVEQEIAVESKCRLTWHPGSHLYEIIDDVKDFVSRNNDFQLVATAFEPPPRGDIARPRRNIQRAVAGVGALMLIPLALIVFQITRDPCAETIQMARSSAAQNTDAGRSDAVMRYAQVMAQATNPVGVSCPRLAADTQLLRDVYLEYGEVLLASNDLDNADAAFARALTLDSQSDQANQGQRAVNNRRIQALWNDALGESTATVDGVMRQVTALKQIRDIDQDAQFSVGTTSVSVILALHDAHVAWGDLLYEQDVDAAFEQYTNAQRLIKESVSALERLKWVDFRRRQRDAKLDSWPGLLDTLDTHATEQANAKDPAGHSIDMIRYQTHIAFGRALLAQAQAASDKAIKVAHIEQANAQIAAVQPYLGAAGDGGAAAYTLRKEITALLGELYPLRLTATMITPDAWTQLLADRGVPARSNKRAVNVILVTPRENVVLKVEVDGNTSTELISSRTGVDFAALQPGRYTFRLDDDQAEPVTLDIGEFDNYLLRLTPHMS